MKNIENQIPSENNLNSWENLLGIEISDDELLNMDPELVIKVLDAKREYREKQKVEALANPKIEEQAMTSDVTGDGLTVLKTWQIESAGITFEEVETKEGLYLGIRITQNGRTYIARNWKLTEEVKAICLKAVELGFSKVWRFGHPQDSYLIGGSNYLKGCHHIGWSKGHSDPWIFVLGAECLKRRGGTQIVKEITFNKHLELYVETALDNENGLLEAQPGPIQKGTFRIQNGGGNCVTTHPKDFDSIITYIAKEKID